MAERRIPAYPDRLSKRRVDVEAQVATPRKGYWHFERVHRIATERAIGCVQCHGDMSPYRPAAHRIDRVAQIDSCRHCHLPSSQSR